MTNQVGDRRPGAAHIAGFLALALFVSACGTSSTDTSTTSPATTVPDDAVQATTTTTTAPEGTYNGLPVGVTEDGYPYLGDPDAPVSLVEFSDYLCPFCRRHATETNPRLLEQYAASGLVRFVFSDFPLVDLHPTAPAGHAAALCVSEQGAARFWPMHTQLFDRQSHWASLGDNSEFLAEVAGDVGADLDAYQSCLDSGRTAVLVDDRVAQARQLGFSGTPSFQVLDHRTGEAYDLVGAQPVETFLAAIDAVIAGEEPADADQPADESNLPFWASEEGLAPDPARPGYNLAGDAYRGNPDADLVVIEISDFQCPFCQRHALETQQPLDDIYVDTDRVLWVFKHLPLQIHPQALAAATAAECAGDQQAFWEMHDLLFERVADWAVAEPDTVLVGLARQLGLEEESFAACVGSRAALERVVEDIYDTSDIFGSTPTFVLLFDGSASVIDGAQPFEQFSAAFDDLLEE